MGRNISILSGPDEIETTCEGATKKNICPDCANEGYTFRDITTYMCDGEQCDCKGGVLKFSKESIARYKYEEARIKASAQIVRTRVTHTEM